MYRYAFLDEKAILSWQNWVGETALDRQKNKI
jgi:hypothetical protein